MLMAGVLQESLQMPFLWPLDCQMRKTNLNIASWYMSECPVPLLRRDLVTTLNAKIPLPPSHFNIRVPQEEACALSGSIAGFSPGRNSGWGPQRNPARTKCGSMDKRQTWEGKNNNPNPNTIVDRSNRPSSKTMPSTRPLVLQPRGRITGPDLSLAPGKREESPHPPRLHTGIYCGPCSQGCLKGKRPLNIRR